jgi:hypothetical protein
MSSEKPLTEQIEELLPGAFGDNNTMQYHELFSCLGRSFEDQYSFKDVEKAVGVLVGRGVLLRPKVDILEYYHSD